MDIVKLVIEGMSCGNCTAAVTRILGAVRGVNVIAVAVGRATIAVEDLSAVNAAMLALGTSGYPAQVADSEEQEPRTRPWWKWGH